MAEQITRRGFIAGAAAAGAAAAAAGLGAPDAQAKTAAEYGFDWTGDKNLRFAELFGITVLHEHPSEAARYLRDTWNAACVDEGLSHKIATIPGYESCECERVALTGLMVQIVKPGPALPGSEEFYEAHGPYFYSCQVMVDDVAAAVESFEAAGARVVAHRAGQDRVPYNAIFEGEGEPLEFAVVDCMEQCGLYFEIMQKNSQLLNHTCDISPRDVAFFMHVEVACVDAHASAEWMCHYLGAERVETDISSTIQGDNASEDAELVAVMPTEHVLWGGFVFQLIAPGYQAHQDVIDAFGTSAFRMLGIHMRVNHRTTAEEGALLLENGSIITPGCEELLHYQYTAMYPEGDHGDPDAMGDVYFIDSQEQCGLRWELLDRSFHWRWTTGSLVLS